MCEVPRFRESMSTLLWLFMLALLVLGWYQLRGLHERAAHLCRQQLHAARLQLLDESIAFAGFSIGKPIRHCHCLQRSYRFEFTEEGHQRQSGQLWFCGKQPVYMVLERDGGTEWIHFGRKEE